MLKKQCIIITIFLVGFKGTIVCLMAYIKMFPESLHPNVLGTSYGNRQNERCVPTHLVRIVAICRIYLDIPLLAL